jgi:uncharacterized membrane protein affecting hemolysin expression
MAMLCIFSPQREYVLSIPHNAKADSKQHKVKESHSLHAYIYVLQNCLLAPSEQKESLKRSLTLKPTSHGLVSVLQTR